MEIVEYDKLPKKIQYKFQKELLNNLVNEHREMGFDYPERWRIAENFQRHLSKTVFFFNKSFNSYHYAVLVELGISYE